MLLHRTLHVQGSMVNAAYVYKQLCLREAGATHAVSLRGRILRNLTDDHYARIECKVRDYVYDFAVAKGEMAISTYSTLEFWDCWNHRQVWVKPVGVPGEVVIFQNAVLFKNLKERSLTAFSKETGNCIGSYQHSSLYMLSMAVGDDAIFAVEGNHVLQITLFDNSLKVEAAFPLDYPFQEFRFAVSEDFVVFQSLIYLTIYDRNTQKTQVLDGLKQLIKDKVSLSKIVVAGSMLYCVCYDVNCISVLYTIHLKQEGLLKKEEPSSLLQIADLQHVYTKLNNGFWLPHAHSSDGISMERDENLIFWEMGSLTQITSMTLLNCKKAIWQDGQLFIQTHNEFIEQRDYGIENKEEPKSPVSTTPTFRAHRSRTS